MTWILKYVSSLREIARLSACDPGGSRKGSSLVVNEQAGDYFMLRTSIETVPSDHIEGHGYDPSPTINHGRAMGARTSMRIPRAMDTRLRALAQQDGTTEAAIVRCALEAYFNYRAAQTI